MGDIVTVVFAESGPLGLSLGSTESGPTVLRFPTPGSLDAAKKKFKQEKLESGLVLSTVQGESVAHLHSEQRLKAIKNAGRPLTLGFLRIEGAESTKKGMPKSKNQDTEEGFVKFVNPLEGDEGDEVPFEGEQGLTEREKHEANRATHTHVDHDQVAPEVESDALVTVIQHLDKVPFFDGMPKKARERCLTLLLSPGL